MFPVYGAFQQDTQTPGLKPDFRTWVLFADPKMPIPPDLVNGLLLHALSAQERGLEKPLPKS